MRVVLLCGILLLAGLAGCIGGEEDAPSDDGSDGKDENGDGSGGDGGNNDEGEETREVGFTLEDLTECDFEYPTGGAVPCSNEFTELTVEARERPSFAGDQEICVYRTEWRNQGFEKWVFWDPVEDTFAIYYEADLPEDASGVNGMIYQAETGYQVNWYDGPANGYIAVPGLQDGIEYAIIVYTHTYETETEALQGGTIRALWSLKDGSTYPLTVVSAEEDYYFNNVTVSESGSNTYFKMEPTVKLQGPDFDITTRYTPYIDLLSTNFNRGHQLGCALT